MNALTTGALIILYILVSQSIAAYIETQANPSFTVDDNCNVGQNETTCQNVSKTSFIASVFDVSVNGFNGAPDFVNAIWVSVNVFLLTLAILLIVAYFVGLPVGGAS